MVYMTRFLADPVCFATNRINVWRCNGQGAKVASHMIWHHNCCHVDSGKGSKCFTLNQLFFAEVQILLQIISEL
jgi:hypothetical protein